MKRLLLLLLCILLLVGCGKVPVTDAPVAQTTEATEPEDPQARLAYRRELAEQYMRHMMSLRWKIPDAVTYSASNSSLGVEADSENQIVQLLPNQVYQGIPYTHGGGSGYSFLALAGEPDEQGVYTLNGLTRELLNGYSGHTIYNTSRLGNDCADAVFWAWAQVSSTITFAYTNQMIPTHGCIRVGDYDCADKPYAGNTSEICRQNGMQRMFEAYACLQKADCLVRTINSSGHAIMAVSVHVKRLEDGTIDGENSYLTYLDQDLACETAALQYEDPVLGPVILFEELNKKRSFSQLYNTGYLPVTCKELIDPAPLAEASVEDPAVPVSAEKLFTGTIKSSYRIAYVQVQITDEQGNIVQEAICFGLQEDMYRFNLNRFTKEAEQQVILGGVDMGSLPKGTYHYRFTCKLSNAEEYIFRQGDIEI